MSIRETIASQFADLSDRAQTWAIRTKRVDTTRWELCEAGHWYRTITAADADAAYAEAESNVDRDNYSDGEGTLYIDIRARNAITGEERAGTVTLEPDEPKCEDGQDHDWQSPYSLLGGLTENPGVWGHGGGAIIKEVCAHCGRYRKTNTWAQRRDTGEQGLTEVSYENADEASQAWVEARATHA